MEFPGFNWKRSGISQRDDQKKIMLNFQGSSFLGLELLRHLTQFRGISRGGALLCLEFPGVKWKMKNFRGVFRKVCPQPSPSPLFDFFLEQPSPDITAKDWQCVCLSEYRGLLDYFGKKIPMYRFTEFSDKSFF